MANRIKEYKDEKHAKLCEQKRQWYQRNKQRVIDRSKRDQKKRKVEVKQWFADLKLELRCIKCGENHPACLDFHHRDDTSKDFDVSKGYKSFGKKRILEEIAKCDVLCCKCHRIFHWEERN